MGRPDFEPRQGQRPDQFRATQKPVRLNGDGEFHTPRPLVSQQQFETGATHHTSVPPFEVMPNNSIRFLDDRFNIKRGEVRVQTRRSRKNKSGFRR